MPASAVELGRLATRTLDLPRWQHEGRVVRLSGLTIEADGPHVGMGQLCTVSAPDGSRELLAEVVALAPGRVVLMPFDSAMGVSTGWRVQTHFQSLHGRVASAPVQASIPVGDELLGRVIDPFGRPIDGLGPLSLPSHQSLHALAPSPMTRPPIKAVMETGVRAIDGLLTMGRGQRVGIFAGSGVGKSTLLGMMARHVTADINVIALIGERGREVREFVESSLGAQGLARSVVVVATSDQPAPTRVRAAYAALAIAEYFRANGKQVLLTMDSVTRFAMAKREIGLAAGEPPTARGYTPSVFAEIPMLCERCGTHEQGGSITALMTVLVEGDDFNEPVADALRATLDGHLVLTRELAEQGHFPAIDVLKSASRLRDELIPDADVELARQVALMLSIIRSNRQLVDIGAYQPGQNPALDQALRVEPLLKGWLCQTKNEPQPLGRATTLMQLKQIMGQAA